MVGLYQGASPYIFSYLVQTAMTYTIYELGMHKCRVYLGEQQFKENEMRCNTLISFIAGGVSAAVTNPFECMTINKQVTNNLNLL